MPITSFTVQSSLRVGAPGGLGTGRCLSCGILRDAVSAAERPSRASTATWFAATSRAATASRLHGDVYRQQQLSRLDCEHQGDRFLTPRREGGTLAPPRRQSVVTVRVGAGRAVLSDRCGWFS